ncbi:helix-turn-helix domain-containing protein [Trichococcus alkaliphilus]|uniref:helix-turn-helix domain-containing protein n=1 Tax=Trichococcus alkaliphilus TaxID=2052943 RepID=UPI00129002DE|nr:helix-turn-helix domain-containing protein [Trichococcus alkaliphilus]
MNDSAINTIVSQCRKKKQPQVIINNYFLTIAGIYVEKTKEVVLLGHVFLGSRSEQFIQTELMRAFNDEAIVKEKMGYIMPLVTTSKSNFFSILEFLNYYLNGEKINISQKEMIIAEASFYDPSELNSMNRERIYEENVYDEIDVYEGFLYEKRIMDSVRTGDKEKLISILKYETNVQAGGLSRKEAVLRQRKNEFICLCTLATRAAIQGGLNVEKAFSLGDYYIRKIESMDQANQVEMFVNKMLLDFAIRVKNTVDIKGYSHVTNFCMQYINDHVCDAIVIQDIADEMGVSKNHLLLKFKEETNVSIVDYIKNVKVAEAKILLKYGHMNITEVSDHLSFSSQSYFTSVFKSITGFTPKQYRERNEEI